MAEENLDNQESQEENQEEQELDESQDQDLEEGQDEGDQEEDQDDPPVDPDEYEIGVRAAPEDTELDYGEDVDPEDAKTIGKIVEKQTASVKQQLQDTQDRIEVDAYLNENPELSKYRGVILKHMKHPAYRQIPVEKIGAMVASSDLLKIGAKKEREAQAKADATKTKGQTARQKGGGAMDWKKAPAEAVEDQIRKVKGQQV